MKKVYIATSSFASFSTAPLRLLKENNFFYSINEKRRKLYNEEIIETLFEYDGVIAGTELYDKDILKNLPKLKIISRLGVGMDNIDLDFANKMNVDICKTTTTPSLAVAELVLGLTLNLIRGISFQNNDIKSGVWVKNMGSLLSKKTLGILGLGNIGKKVVEISSGLNLDIVAYDENHDRQFAKKFNVKYLSFDEFLAKSDIISIHLNLSKETKKIIDYEALKKMKKNSILINTSRGEIVDENSLIKALDNKIIMGAGLDVYENEPYSGSLLNYNNVICTPHIGAYAKEVRNKMELEAVENLVNGLKK